MSDEATLNSKRAHSATSSPLDIGKNYTAYAKAKAIHEKQAAAEAEELDYEGTLKKKCTKVK